MTSDTRPEISTGVADDFTYGYRPDSELTHEQVIDRNMRVVDAHFHNENPDSVERAIDLYADEISWEAPTRGIVLDNRDDILASYRGIFDTIRYRRTTALRRFATEQFVFDDSIGEVTIAGDGMENLPYGVGTEVNCRLVHLFEMKDGKIVREIAYEMWRKQGSAVAVDFIPADAVITNFAEQ